ncbi:phenylalanine--tRNA ligase subunit beta [Candidatus Nitrosocosmicus arcticus]|uniref:phenylalanine--tRNA ligase n=1 Tax=Candidatus Nitrosocosmicus arcticus TaxID=2035267 RepID=A0A557SXD0_9ARCH|nr:phenylalanine--tRNA ligase subunit beta [Candidatus Nitrosocosmicus arcticus]TVP41260.1 Phenylalanine-tRNA ligase beta chain [Candidatus Nitrosocosmicus arcticus]
MPVVNVRPSLLSKIFSERVLDEIIEKLPYLGLDIEGIDKIIDKIRIEFNPNRPDFSSENGIVRALKGILNIELGRPIIQDLRPSLDVIRVDKRLKEVRPIIYGLIAKRDIPITHEELTQLISMQEDLHNGLGRKRKKSSIGIHNYDALTFPLFYKGVPRQIKFVPLDGNKEYSIDNILTDFEVGKKYGHILKQFDIVPMLLDSKDNVVSFPPIINGNTTKVDLLTSNLFVEVTSVNSKSAMDILSILSFELSDMGFDLYTVEVSSPFCSEIVTPILEPHRVQLDFDYINKILGLELTHNEILVCLQRSRCEGIDKGNGKLECIIPSYRIDLFDKVDICEEVAIGYGIYNLEPSYPSSYFPGRKNSQSIVFDKVRDILIGLEFMEIINPHIISKNLFKNVFLEDEPFDKQLISLGDSKNTEFEVLRSSLIPSLINTFSNNIHEKYPQKLFEMGKTFFTTNKEVRENWSLCVSIAHNTTDYTEIKSNLESFMRYCFNAFVTTPRNEAKYFLPGHSARIVLNDEVIGEIGEIHPQVLENLNLRTLVTIFEFNLSAVIKIKT